MRARRYNEMIKMNIRDLSRECIEIFRKSLNSSLPITTPSIPILYFGNKPAYNKSKIKIITVGLNPSYNEFPVNDRFKYFRKAENINLNLELTQDDIRLYLEALNDYFIDDSYNWFKWFEPILNGMNASYYENKDPNRVLHTDICSPFATNLTWSKKKFHRDQKANMIKEGKKIWHKLVELLDPDIIIISVAKKYLKNIQLNQSKWIEFHRIYRKQDGTKRKLPYIVTISKYNTSTDKGYLVFGQAAQIPFGTISGPQKHELGQKLLTLARSRAR